ncbi:MAG: DUF445 family protein [Gemmatimonadota bacterium]
MSPELLRSLLTVVFGALAGGLTNTIAVWMLFHPYRPPRIGPFRIRFLHGAIPKNQDRLAEAVGRTVGNRLLTEADLTRILTNQEFRDAFDRRLEGFIRSVAETERGSLRDLLPPEFLREIEPMLEGVVDLLEGRLGSWLDSPDFERTVEARVESLLDGLAGHPVRELLTEEREAALTDAVETWLDAIVDRPGFRRAVRDYLDRVSTSLLRDDRTFEEVLPAGLAASLERAISSYLPLAVQKLGGILEDPGARARLESVVHDMFQRFLRDLRFHQRMMARLVVTESTLDKMLRTLEEEGAEHLSEMLRDPAVQEATAIKINDAVYDFLERPVTSVLGKPGDENVERAKETIVEWIVTMGRDPETLRFLADRMRLGVRRAAENTWGDLLGSVPSGKVAGSMVAVARSNAAREAYREVLTHFLRSLLDRPIGRPARWLPSGSPGRIEQVLSEPLWGWLQGQIPEIVRTLDVARRVEEKVRGYPTKKMEALVRRVTERELRLIIRLGYVLGAGIGGMLLAVNALLG